MRNITLLILVLLSNPVAAQQSSMVECLQGAVAPTPTYVACPSDVRPLAAEGALSGRINTRLIEKANRELAYLRRNGKGHETRIAALEAAVKVLESRAQCNGLPDTAAVKACYAAQSDMARALRGEAVALAAVAKGSVKMEVAQGAGNGSPGYYFQLETPTPTESPLALAALDARLSLSADESLQPIEHLGALGAIGFTLGGALIGGSLGYGLGDEGSTQTLPDGTVDDDDGDQGSKAAIGAAIGAGSGLVLWGVTEGIIALTNSNRAETRRRLVADGAGAGVRF